MHHIVSLGLAMAVLLSLISATAAAQNQSTRKTYLPTWESLDTHPTPQWFQDAKLGLFVYPPSPVYEEWEKHGRRGAYCGAPWTEMKWDPDKIAQLALEMGAKYVVFGIDSYSLFLMYPSKYAYIPGSPFLYIEGNVPRKRDYVGELAKAVRKRGLRFGLYRNYLHPKNYPYWFETMQEMIDRYQPSTLWLDGEKLSYPAEELRSRELVAYYYNHSRNPEEVAVEDTLGSHKVATWGVKLDRGGDWYRKEAGMTPPMEEISEGYFVRYEEVVRGDDRSPVGESQGTVDNKIEWLADAVSHNGNLELAIWIAPEDAYQAQARVLRQVGDWLVVNGEAIYGTRPWREGVAQAVTDTGIHIRYTTKGDSLYAILFKYPRGRFILPNLKARPDTTVQMLGTAGNLRAEQTPQGLAISMTGFKEPPGWPLEYVMTMPCDHAFTFKITPRPDWVR